MPAGPQDFVEWFRTVSPYIHNHRGRTFVICFGGEMVLDRGFPSLIHDIALLNSLGVRQVLVYGTRPQIEARLKSVGADIHYVNGLRVTDEQALTYVKEAAGTVRIEIEALLSLGLPNSPMANASIRVASGNFITAKPSGVREGTDLRYTGEVRRVDTKAIHAQLSQGDIVVIPPVGYSPTGEVFNLDADEVATAVAISLRASKLIFMLAAPGVLDGSGTLVRQLTDKEAQQFLIERRSAGDDLSELECAMHASRNGVGRTHLIDQTTDGALLLELFQRDGIGTLVSGARFDDLRPAAIDDVGGVLELIAPLEAQGVLVRRSREKLEMEMDRFTVLVRDGAIIGCAALYPYPHESVAELACLAVHPSYQDAGRGSQLFMNLENNARSLGLKTLFVLTTHTAHWFIERGFTQARIEDLPVARQGLYNYQRNSKVFIKSVA